MTTRLKTLVATITLVASIALGTTALAQTLTLSTVPLASPNDTLPPTNTAQLIQPSASGDVLFQPNARIVGVE